MEWVIQANSLSAGLLRPDLNIYIDISPEVSMERLIQNRESTEMYETLENLNKVRIKYSEAFKLLKSEEKIFSVNGNRSPQIIATDIWAKVSDFLEKKIIEKNHI